MGKTSKSSADNKSLRNRNATAISAKFPKAKLLAQFEKMAKATGTEAEATEAKRQTAFMVCSVAADYRSEAIGNGKGQTHDVTTVLDSWREHWKSLIAELHAKNNPMVELGEANKAGEQKPVMTGYGRNVASTARGVIEHNVSVLDNDGKERAYTDITKTITAERRASLPEDKRTVNAAKEGLTESLAAMRKQLGSSADAIAAFTGLVVFCTHQLTEHGTDGLLAIGLALEDADIDEYLTDTSDDETKEAANDTDPVDDTTEADAEIVAA